MIPDYHFISGFGSVYIQFTQKQNGPYSGFRLKTRFCGQNDKNLNNFSVTTDMAFVIGG